MSAEQAELEAKQAMMGRKVTVRQCCQPKQWCQPERGRGTRIATAGQKRLAVEFRIRVDEIVQGLAFFAEEGGECRGPR
jgi:hypothetical protein